MNGVTNGDRKVLIVLLVLVLALIGYMGISGAKPIRATDTPSVGIRDTVYIEVPDSLAGVESGDRLPIRTDRYPGPPQRVQYQKKLSAGATIDLNSADTLLLMRVPGIGPSFARRICKYRELLGGYYVVEQLQEVYGMDRERYDQIAPFMRIKTKVRPLVVTRDSIPRHPYLQWQHVRAIEDLYRSGRELNWKALMDSGKFSRDDSLRLSPYLTFQGVREVSLGVESPTNTE